MTNKKFASGAFVFTRARGLKPKLREDIIPIAERHGIDPSVIPPYAGDRAAVGRTIARTDTRIAGDTYLLRPIRRNSTEVTYGIVRENKNGDDHLDHDHECTVAWKAESDPAVIEGDHTIANRIRMDYRDLRGKLCTEDWTKTIGEELERLGAVAMRDDGRVHWLPQSSLDDVRKLQGFLSEVGVTLFLAKVESENTGIVTEVVAESVEEQLHKLELEVQDFSETSKPSMFARRLSIYQELRQKALLYQSALGIGAERTEQVLAELETKVSAMLDVRTKTVVHRDGTVTKKGESTPKPETSPSPEPKTETSGAKETTSTSESKTETSGAKETTSTPESKAAKTKSKKKNVTKVTSLTFAGATFNQADSDTDGELLFTSSDEHAISSVKALEAMGLAGKWQKAGSVEVVLQNSGPPGKETSIRLRLPEEMELKTAKKALGALGIEVA
jgi:hypothetical protein